MFPETAVWIVHEGSSPFFGNPARVTLYNTGQRYIRREFDPAGDRCTWFAVADDVMRDVIGARDPEAAESDRPLRWPYGPVRPGTYYRQRLIARQVLADRLDRMFVEEGVINLFADVVSTVYEHARQAPRAGTSRQRKHEIVEQVSSRLYRTCTVNHSLTAIAAGVGLSVFHLCRLFRRETGLTMHAYRHRMRLTRALEALGEPDVDLLSIAVELGYCSHSHFTNVFRRQLGLVPSDVREQLARSMSV